MGLLGCNYIVCIGKRGVRVKSGFWKTWSCHRGKRLCEACGVKVFSDQWVSL